MNNITIPSLLPLTQFQRTDFLNLLNYSADYINSKLARPVNWNLAVTTGSSNSADLLDNIGFDQNGRTGNVFINGKAVYQTYPHLESQFGTTSTFLGGRIFISTEAISAAFIDPTPATANDIPSDSIDAFGTIVSLMLGTLAFYPGTSSAPSITASKITSVNGVNYFNGENAQAVYGRMVPLNTADGTRLGNASGDGIDLANDLMSGVGYQTGTRVYMTDLHLAMLADVGIGTIRSDVLRGTNANDNIAAGAGKDTIYQSAGNDVINGGDDADTMVYSGRRSTYGIKNNADGTVTVSKGFTSDVLTSIETFKFSDQVTTTDSASNVAIAYRIYKAAFNRAPDQSGLNFWTDYLQKGNSLTQVSQGFIGAPEFAQTYGSNITNATFVNKLYQNVLGRAGEASGFAFWTGVLDNNSWSRAQVMAGFSESPENKSVLAGVISNGISYEPL